MDFIDLLAYCRSTGVITEEQYYQWLPNPATRKCFWCKMDINLRNTLCDYAAIKGSPELGIIWNHEECQEMFWGRVRKV